MQDFYALVEVYVAQLNAVVGQYLATFPDALQQLRNSPQELLLFGCTYILLCGVDVLLYRKRPLRLAGAFIDSAGAVLAMLLATWLIVVTIFLYAPDVPFSQFDAIIHTTALSVAASGLAVRAYVSWPGLMNAWPPLQAQVRLSPLGQALSHLEAGLADQSLTATTAPVRAMQLKLRRSKRAGGFLGMRVIFALDARVDLSAEEQGLVNTFSLGKLVVYESQARKQRNEAAYAHFDSAMHVGWDAASAGKSMWRNLRGIASATMMAVSLRVTINSLMRGQHIECKDLNELLGAESAVIDACKNLRAYLDTAATFNGSEEVLEF